MENYLDILHKVLVMGQRKTNRTGIDTFSLSGVMFEHDMQEGFPLLTTKKMGIRNIGAELAMFLRGITRKEFLHERGCHIWDEWHSPASGDENELGPIYGAEWNSFTAPRVKPASYVFPDLDVTAPEVGSPLVCGEWLRNEIELLGADWSRVGPWIYALPGIHGRLQGDASKPMLIDPDAEDRFNPGNICYTYGDGLAPANQLRDIYGQLLKGTDSRRLVCSAWNPGVIGEQALPPCHVLWNVTVRGEYLDLMWYQRSADMFLGVPYDIASYGLLLTILAGAAGLKPGRLCGALFDAHIYENHLEQVQEQLSREPRELPKVEVACANPWAFEPARDIVMTGYDPLPPIKAPVAV